MSYRKGKDIKVPFDCLWHCMTRKYDAIIMKHTADLIITNEGNPDYKEFFEKW